MGGRNLDARQRNHRASPSMRSTRAFAATHRSTAELPDKKPVHVARVLGFGADGVLEVIGFVFSKIKELIGSGDNLISGSWDKLTAAHDAEKISFDNSS